MNRRAISLLKIYVLLPGSKYTQVIVRIISKGTEKL